MKIKSEKEILDINVRKLIISDMLGMENQDRKLASLRRHEVYRDKTKKWVIQSLFNEGFKPETIAQMQNRASNLSICRKIVNKLAQTYVGGVERKAVNEAAQVSIDLLSDELDINTVMKKSDRYRQLFKNTAIQIVGIPCNDVGSEESPLYEILIKVLASWEYDVVKDYYNPEKAMCFILTEFPERSNYTLNSLSGSQGYRGDLDFNASTGNGMVETIASNRDDAGKDKRTFIWWSNSYHFTTDINGDILAIPGQESNQNENPIGVLPFVDIHMDQDGDYWASGGEDLIDSSILINKELTDLNFVTFHQGFGQLVISGKDLPKKLEGGPNNAMLFDVKDGDPTPQVFYATSNPPVESWLTKIKAQIAALLSTNDLSPKLISANLDASNVESGISKLIENSEVTATHQDVQTLYQDKEPEMWEIIRRWHALYKETNSLTEELAAIPTFEDSDVKVKFSQLKPIVSEKEQLEVLKMRKELGLDTLSGIIQKDNPDLSEDEAKAKAEEIKKEKMENAPDLNQDPNAQDENSKDTEEEDPKEKEMNVEES